MGSEFGLNNIIFIVITLASFFCVFFFSKRMIDYLKVAKPDNRFDRKGERIWHTIRVAIFQSKILRFRIAGLIHVGIFWGFAVLMVSASQAILEGFGFSHPWDWLGPIYSVLTVMTDFFCLFVLLAVMGSFVRRFVIKVPRLQSHSGDEKKDAIFILTMISWVVTSLLLTNASAMTLGIAGENAVYPVAGWLGGLWNAEAAEVIYPIAWWFHILLIFGFMNYLPFSKHLHVYTSIQNVFLSKIEPVNTLDPINFEEEGVEKFGVVDIDDFSWKTLFDSYSCTHCGRCDSVCPANETGKELSPRQIIIAIRQRTLDYAPILLRQKKEEESANREGREIRELKYSESEQKIMDKKLIGDYISPEALWQCTTCGACMQECPVNIEHVPAIVGMRRSLVMMEAAFPTELSSPFQNFETNSTPWAFSAAERADWAEGLGVKTAAEDPEFDVLFWVGCFGSFDDRAKKISVAFSKLMQKAEVKFAILGTEEQCNGDTARRAGNEYLADMMIKMNIDTFTRYNVKKIVTTCPHCFNTLKNEYPQFGGEYEVVHHSEFLSQLIDSGKLKLSSQNPLKAAYHDSCYLGRYNDMYSEPRDLVKKVPGLELLEVKRNESRGFCCGAGGGQMFMEETVGKRVNIDRTEELIETGADTLASNCPFCMTMLIDGVKAKDKEEEIAVKDISEIILENLAE